METAVAPLLSPEENPQPAKKSLFSLKALGAFLLGALVLLGCLCGLFALAASAVPSSPLYLLGQVTQEDIDRLQEVDDFLAQQEETWDRLKFLVYEEEAIMAWESHALKGVIQIEIRVFDRPYHWAELRSSYTEKAFQEQWYPNYPDLELQQQCATPTIHLFVLRATFDRKPYTVLHWAIERDNQRLEDTTLVLPQARKDRLQDYAAGLVPDLSLCR